MDEAHREAASFWATFAEHYNARPGKRTVGVVPELVGDLHGRLEGAILLDLACGAGRGSRILAEEVGPEGLVVAVDLTAAMLEQARAENGLPQIEYVLGSAERTTLADGAVDHAFCNLGLMLFPSAPAALTELRRVVRPGGTFRAGVWGREDRSSMMTLAGEAARRAGLQLPQPPVSKFHLGSPEALSAAAKGTGWRLLRTQPAEVVFPYASPEEACEDLGLTLEATNPRLRPLVGEDWAALSRAAREVAAERLEGGGSLRLDMLVGVFGDP